MALARRIPMHVKNRPPTSFRRESTLQQVDNGPANNPRNLRTLQPGLRLGGLDKLCRTQSVGHRAREGSLEKVGDCWLWDYLGYPSSRIEYRTSGSWKSCIETWCGLLAFNEMKLFVALVSKRAPRCTQRLAQWRTPCLHGVYKSLNPVKTAAMRRFVFENLQWQQSVAKLVRPTTRDLVCLLLPHHFGKVTHIVPYEAQTLLPGWLSEKAIVDWALLDVWWY